MFLFLIIRSIYLPVCACPFSWVYFSVIIPYLILNLPQCVFSPCRSCSNNSPVSLRQYALQLRLLTFSLADSFCDSILQQLYGGFVINRWNSPKYQSYVNISFHEKRYLCLEIPLMTVQRFECFPVRKLIFSL